MAASLPNEAAFGFWPPFLDEPKAGRSFLLFLFPGGATPPAGNFYNRRWAYSYVPWSVFLFNSKTGEIGAGNLRGLGILRPSILASVNDYKCQCTSSMTHTYTTALSSLIHPMACMLPLMYTHSQRSRLSLLFSRPPSGAAARWPADRRLLWLPLSLDGRLLCLHLSLSFERHQQRG